VKRSELIKKALNDYEEVSYGIDDPDIGFITRRLLFIFEEAGMLPPTNATGTDSEIVLETCKWEDE